MKCNKSWKKDRFPSQKIAAVEMLQERLILLPVVKSLHFIFLKKKTMRRRTVF